MADIKKELNDIKNAVYGREVRSSIHDGIKKINEESEKSKQKAEEAHEITRDLLDETFDSAALEANFEQRLNDEIENLQPEWTGFKNNVTAQLAQTENKFNVNDWELSSKDRMNKGLVVFISDDGTRYDWDILKPIFVEEGVPLCLAIISDAISPPNLSDDELREAESMGWEILSHATRNVDVSTLPDEEAEKEYRDSKHDLLARGFNVQSYSTPLGGYNQRERLLAKKYYRAARVSDYGEDGLNHSPIETYELKTIWLDEKWGRTDFQYFKEHIDKAIEHNALLIISTHGHAVQEETTQQTFREVVRYARDNAEVVTLRDALNKMGNLIEVGDFTKNGQGTRAPATESFVVGANGDYYPKNVTTMNKFSPDTPFSELPFGVSITPINIEKAKQTNVPEEIAGLLVNYKTVNNDTYYSGFNRQEYHIFGRDKVYKRFLQSGGEFSEWTLSGGRERHEISNNITIPANSQTNVVVDSVDVRISDLVIVTPKYPLPPNIFFNYSVGGDNVLRIHLFNFGSQDLGFDKDWFVDIIKQ